MSGKSSVTSKVSVGTQSEHSVNSDVSDVREKEVSALLKQMKALVQDFHPSPVQQTINNIINKSTNINIYVQKGTITSDLYHLKEFLRKHGTTKLRKRTIKL